MLASLYSQSKGYLMLLSLRFYNGAHIEKDILNRAYLRLIKHVNSIFKIRIVYGMIEGMSYLLSRCLVLANVWTN